MNAEEATSENSSEDPKNKTEEVVAEEAPKVEVVAEKKDNVEDVFEEATDYPCEICETRVSFLIF